MGLKEVSRNHEHFILVLYSNAGALSGLPNGWVNEIIFDFTGWIYLEILNHAVRLWH